MDRDEPRRAFWLWNVGLAWMVLVGDIPVGFLQLETVFTQGYDAARSLAFYNQSIVQLLFSARLPGDILVILGSSVFCYDVLKKRFVRREDTTPSSDRTIISRRIFGEEKESGVDIGDD